MAADKTPNGPQNVRGQNRSDNPDNGKNDSPSRKPKRKRGGESLEDRILFSGTWADVDTGDMIDGATDGADAFTGSDADEIVAGLDGNDDLFGGGGDDILSGGAGDDVLNGGEGNDQINADGGSDTVNAGAGDDTVTVSDAEPGDVITVSGGDGQDRLDLSAYSSDSVTFSEGSLEVSTGDGSFTVNYSDIESISFADADASFLEGDAAGSVSGGADILIAGEDAVSIGMDGPGSVSWEYDADSGEITITGTEGTDADSTLVVDDLGTDGLTPSSVKIESDLGSIQSDADLGSVEIDHEAHVGTITVGDGAGSIESLSFTGGDVTGDPVEVNANVGTIETGRFEADLTVNGDVGTIAVGGGTIDADFTGDLTVSGDLDRMTVSDDFEGALHVGGDAGELSAGDDFKGAGAITIDGDLGSITAGDAITKDITVGGDAGAISAGGTVSGDISVGEDLVSFNADHATGDLNVAGNAGAVTIDGSGSNADFRGDLFVGGNLSSLDVADDVEGSITVNGNAGMLTAGDDFKGDGSVTIGGNLQSMTAGDRIAVDVSVGKDIRSINAPMMTGDLHVGDDLFLLNVGEMQGTITGGSDHNFMRTSDSSEQISTGERNDRVYANGGDDTVDLGSGNDWVQGGAGDDTLDGGDGRDMVSYTDVQGGGVNVDLEAGTATGAGGTDTITNFENAEGSNQADTLSGTSGNNTLEGEGGNDVITAGDGNDYVRGGTGDDVMDGGEGTDSISYNDIRDGGVDIDLEAGTATGAGGNDSFTNFENAYGSNQDDTIVGDAGNNMLDGERGDDVISAGDGNDQVYGGLGDDTLDGGEGTDWVRYNDIGGDGVNVDLEAGTATGAGGNDTISNFENVFGSRGDDTIQGDTGDNRIQGHSGDDTIRGGAGDDTLDGDGGTDTVSYSDIEGGGVDVNLADGTATGAGGNDTLRDFENAEGSNQNDTITGNSGNNVLSGLDGDDTINAGAGNDTVYGGAGADTIDGGAGNDTLLYGEGADTVSGGDGNDFIDDAVGAVTNTTGVTLDGGAGNDTIYGGHGEDDIIGGTGNDRLHGHAGDDTISGGEGNDYLRGDEGNDVLDGGTGDDRFIAGTGDDTLLGGAGTDTADYSSSRDAITVDLNGGTVTSDAGNDTFESVESFVGSNADDTFLFNDPSAGDHFTIDGHGGSNTLDLSNFSRTDIEMTPDGDSIVVTLPSGGSATVDFSNIDRVILSDADFDPNVAPHGAVADQGTLNEDGSFTTGQLLDTDAIGNGRAFVENIQQPEHGTVTVNDDGTFTYTPDPDYSGMDSFSYTIDDVTGDTTATVTLNVTPDADAPVVVVTDAAGTEDAAIPLDLSASLTDLDGSETLSVTIGNVPDGASLSAGTDNGDGSWTLNPDQLDGLSITPPADFAGEFELAITATTTDGTDTASASDTLSVSVSGDADAADLTVSNASGVEDSAIALDLSATLTDVDGSETLSVTIGNVPDGASLSAGTDNGDGSWTLSPDQLDGLSITPPADFAGEFDLSVTATSIEGSISEVSFSEDTITSYGGGGQDRYGDVLVTDNGSGLSMSGNTWKDIPFPVTITEDTVLEFEFRSDGEAEIQGIGFDNDEGINSNRTFKIHGTQNWGIGTDQPYSGDGEWQTIRIPVGEFFTGDFDKMTFTHDNDAGGDATSQFRNIRVLEGADTATVSESITVSVESVADAADLSVADATGTEDTAIPLDFSVSLTDIDGSETLSVTIGNLPEGASLSAGIDNGDGSWMLTADQLDGLSITPPADFAGEFDLDITATTTDGTDTVTVNETVSVTVDAVADEADLAVADASGTEDSAIALDLSPSLTDVDGSETLSVTIGNVPDGASLSAGTDNGDGTWTLNPDQLDGLSITPPADFAGDFDLDITATTTDGSDTETVNETVSVTVEAVADGADLSVNDASGSEDAAIALDLSASLTDLDGSERLVVTISDVPDGASLSAGVNNGDGTWTLQPGQLDGLAITPPSDFSGELQLGVTATTYESGSGENLVTNGSFEDDDIRTRSWTVRDSMAGWTLSEGAGIEIQDNVAGAAADGGQHIELDSHNNSGIYQDIPTSGDSSYEISFQYSPRPGVPAESNAIDVYWNGEKIDTITEDGRGSRQTDWNTYTYTLEGSEGDATRLEFRAAGREDSLGGYLDDVSVRETGDAVSTSSTMMVQVDAVADSADLSVADATGTEDAAIPLDLSASLTDLDGSETLSVTIGNVPEGASLSAGTDNGDGLWTLNPDQLDGLSITPPADFSGEFDLEITATTTDGSDTATVNETVSVTVDAVADEADLSASAASGAEDEAISLEIDASLTDTDGSESLAVTISNVPEGASLSAGTDNRDGTWTLTPEQLQDLTITPPADSDTDFTLTVSATTTEADSGDTTTTVRQLPVGVEAVADEPVLSVGEGDDTISFRVSGDEYKGFPKMRIMVNGEQVGSPIQVTADHGSDAWQEITIRGDFGGEGPQSVEVEFTNDAWGGSSDKDRNLYVDHITVNGEQYDAEDSEYDRRHGSDLDGRSRMAWAGKLVFDTSDAPAHTITVSEDTPIALPISANLTDTDGSESLSAITVSGMPEGSTLSAGVDNGDGTWSVGSNVLDGLTVSTADGYSGTFDLGISVASSEADGDSAESSATIRVHVESVADAATIEAGAVSGFEDQPIALDLSASLNDLDGSESLSVTIGNVPEGAALSAGTDNGDGTWTLTPEQLEGLELSPPSNFSGEIELAVKATTTDGTDTASVSDTVSVTVSGTADAADLTVSNASGVEDEAIALDLSSSLNDTDGSETLSVTISNVPEGAALSAGTDNGDGTWTLTPEQLEGLELSPPSNFSGEIELAVKATTTDGTDTASVSDTVSVTVSGTADAADLTVSNASGVEDEAIALDLSSSLNDTDGSETLSVTISNVPEGAALSAGTDNGDGTWTLTPEQLEGLELSPPSNFSGEIELAVKATTTDGTDTASVSDTVSVTVSGTADAADLTVSNASGVEDEAIALDLSSSLNDTDGSETLSVTISNVPEGAALSAGTDNGDGTWTLTPEQLEGLELTPPSNYAGEFELGVTATTTDGTTTQTVSDAFTVSVAGVSDGLAFNGPSEISAITGENTPLGLSARGFDPDGSESLRFTVSGLPEGVALTEGTPNPDGTWSLTPDELGKVSIDTSAGYAGSFDLTVTGTAIEADGDAASASTTLSINIAPPVDTTPESQQVDAIPAPPGEIMWDDDVELGVIDTVSEIDQTLEDIEGQVEQLDLPSTDPDTPREALGYTQIAEVPPLETAKPADDSPLPPPSDPIFEFTHDAGSTDRATDDAGRLSVPGARTQDAPDAEVEDAAEKAQTQFGRSFAFLWGLVRSLGGRPIEDRAPDQSRKN